MIELTNVYEIENALSTLTALATLTKKGISNAKIDLLWDDIEEKYLNKSTTDAEVSNMYVVAKGYINSSREAKLVLMDISEMNEETFNYEHDMVLEKTIELVKILVYLYKIDIQTSVIKAHYRLAIRGTLQIDIERMLKVNTNGSLKAHYTAQNYIDLDSTQSTQFSKVKTLFETKHTGAYQVKLVPKGTKNIMQQQDLLSNVNTTAMYLSDIIFVYRYKEIVIVFDEKTGNTWGYIQGSGSDEIPNVLEEFRFLDGEVVLTEEAFFTYHIATPVNIDEFYVLLHTHNNLGNVFNLGKTSAFPSNEREKLINHLENYFTFN